MTQYSLISLEMKNETEENEMPIQNRGTLSNNLNR